MKLQFSYLRRYYETLMFSLIQLMYWSANCALYSFVVMFLKDQGYSDSMCGVVSGLLACLGILIHPLAGYVSDTFFTAKRLLSICFGIAIPLTLILPRMVSMGLIFVVGITCLSFFDYYQYSLLDSWIIKLSQTQVDIEFSRIRSFGSLGYGVSALIMGRMIANFGYNTMFYAHSLLLLLALLFLLPMPEVPCSNKQNSEGKKGLSFFEVGKILMKNKRYMVLMASVAVYQFGIRPSITFLALVIQNAGGDSTHLGMATFLAAGFEFPVMLIASMLLRRGIKRSYLMVVALSLAAVRIWMLSLPLPLEWVLGMQLLGALSMGLYISVFTQYIAEITPREIMATATTMGTALTFNTGGVIGIFIGGVLSEQLGILGYVRLCGILCTIAVFMFLPNVWREFKNKDVA